MGVSVAELLSVRVSGNTSVEGGGGVGAEFINIVMTGSTRVSGNRTLDGFGGGLHLYFTGKYEAGCSRVSGNRSSNGRESDAVYHMDSLGNLGDPITNFPCKK